MNSYQYWSSIDSFVITFIVLAAGFSWLAVYNGINDLGCRFGMFLYRWVPRFWISIGRGVRALTWEE